ncbi:unnamed protein product [Leuciscus chuanchicus]
MQWKGAVAGQTVALCVRERGARRGGVVLVLRWERGDLGVPWERRRGGQGSWRHCASLPQPFISHAGEVGQLLGPRLFPLRKKGLRTPNVIPEREQRGLPPPLPTAELSLWPG